MEMFVFGISSNDPNTSVPTATVADENVFGLKLLRDFWMLFGMI